MAQKKKNRLVPVMMNEIVSGQEYLRVGVAADGMLWLEVHKFHGRPFTHRDSWKIRTHNGVKFLSDAGMIPGSWDNHHRVFRFTEQNRQKLELLVLIQNIKGYLKLIGVENPNEVLKKMDQFYAILELNTYRYTPRRIANF